MGNHLYTAPPAPEADPVTAFLNRDTELSQQSNESALNTAVIQTMSRVFCEESAEVAIWFGCLMTTTFPARHCIYIYIITLYTYSFNV